VIDMAKVRYPEGIAISGTNVESLPILQEATI